jgi:hypothetical protein
VLGTVTRVDASDEPLLAPSPSTAVIKIDKVYAGSEIAGDQTGRTATVILSQPGQRQGGEPGPLLRQPTVSRWAFTASPSLDFSQVQLGLLVSF